MHFLISHPASHDYPCLLRPGPSASEAGSPSGLHALVDALKIVKGLLTDDSVKTACENICPQLSTLFPESDEEVEDAKKGLPSSSKPKKPTMTKPAFTPEPPAEVTPTKEMDPEVNSSTHRAAHARLVRRMDKLDAVKFPQMHKLWAGNRKET